jgi:hypothetical protein
MYQVNYLNKKIYITSIMTYECEHCGYETLSKCNIEKHKNRKYPCHRTIHGNENKTKKVNLGDMVCAEPAQKRPVIAHYIHAGNPELKSNESSLVNRSKHTCHKCSKIFARKSNLARHETTCKYVETTEVNNSLQCETCKKTFQTAKGKYQHIKNVSCDGFYDTCAENINVVNNSVQYNQTTNNIDNSVHNTQTNNIHINVFGQEDLSYLLKDTGMVYRINNYSKEGVYGLVKMIDEIFMNKERPENNTLIKPQERGEGLYIRQNDDWEYREYEDVKDSIVSSLDRYIDMYHKVKKGNNIKLTDPKERNRIKQLIVLLIAIGGMTNQELCKELSISQNDISFDEDDDKINKKFDKATMNRLHTKTDIMFQKEGGGWISKNSS